jgi:hypothetical protein
MVQAKPTILELDMGKLEDVLQRAAGQLREEDFAMLKALVDAYSYLTEVVGNKNTTIARLRKLLFGAKTEKTAAVTGRHPSNGALSALAASDAPATAATTLQAVPDQAKADGEAATGPQAEGQSTSSQEAGADAKTDSQASGQRRRKGHGRNGADDYTGAEQIEVPHPLLQPGDPCPQCPQGTVYETDRPGVLVRLVGQAPVGAKVYRLQKLRCGTCGGVFAPDPPPGVDAEQKCDATVGSMIALLKYGTGMPFNRNETLQESLGVPLPASTQWQIVAAQAERAEPVFEEMVQQAAQGDMMYNDDTPAKILAMMGKRATAEGMAPGTAASACSAVEDSAEEMAEEVAEAAGTAQRSEGKKPETQRKGMFTTGIVSTPPQGCPGQKIVLFFTGRQHAGENLEDVLARRATDRPSPIQMCDALSRNVPKNLETILANCLAHGRRQFTDVAELFPAECGHVLDSLSVVYGNDATAEERKLSPQERLLFHQTESGPVMAELHAWLGRQLDERRVEPNSALGKAVAYLLRHWEKLTLFLRVPGAPLDNNLCERALKMAIRHRKNSLFYKTPRGAHVGDVFMSLIHTCRLCGANPFDYLTELDRHAAEAASNPGAWMPWNYRQQLAPAAAASSAVP